MGGQAPPAQSLREGRHSPGGRGPAHDASSPDAIGEVRNLPAGVASPLSDKISCLGARQLVDHALAGPLPLLQEDQEIGHLLPVRPLVELPDDVGADLALGGKDSKEIPTRRWSERVSEASRILPIHRGRERISGLAAGEPGQGERRESATDVRLDGDEMAADADDGDAGDTTRTYMAAD